MDKSVNELSTSLQLCFSTCAFINWVVRMFDKCSTTLFSVNNQNTLPSSVELLHARIPRLPFSTPVSQHYQITFKSAQLHGFEPIYSSVKSLYNP